MFSFLIPVYNTKKYLPKCLESVLCQIGAPFEVILIDDGSTDGSSEICDDYARRYPDIVRVIHKSNEGLLLTRRRGFKEAKGDWLVCVDSDDYIAEDYLSEVSKIVADENVDMVMIDYYSAYPDGKIELSGIDIKEKRYFSEINNKEEIYKLRLLKNKYNNMWSKIIRHDIIDFENDYSIFGVKNMCEDVIQSYELFTRAQNIVFLPKPLYYYRREINSITSNQSGDYWNSIKIGLDLGWKYITLWKMPNDVTIKYASRCVSFYCDYLRWAEKNGCLTNVVSKMRTDEFFCRAKEIYSPSKLSTMYLKVSVPLLMKLLDSQNINGIKRYFSTEGKILNLLRK